MVVLLEVSPTQNLWSSARVTIGFLVTSLTKALLLRHHGLVFPLKCIVSYETLYRQVYINLSNLSKSCPIN